MKTTEYLTLPKAVENIQTLADRFLLQSFALSNAYINDNGNFIYIVRRFVTISFNQLNFTFLNSSTSEKISLLQFITKFIDRRLEKS